ncbi:hypothetical protein OCV73_07520 [Barnesiella propionica]|nr:hypothetical protein [Barnesiella propionica]MCU6768791.1 hypothetical protein [Barnesiella propionica]
MYAHHRKQASSQNYDQTEYPRGFIKSEKKSFNKGKRKPKLNPRTHCYSFNLDDVENAKFLAFYYQSGYKVKAHLLRTVFSESRLRYLGLIKARLIITFNSHNCFHNSGA